MPIESKSNRPTPSSRPAKTGGLQPADLPLAIEIGQLFRSFGSDHAHNLAMILKFALEKVPGRFAVYHRFDFERQRIETVQETQPSKGFQRTKGLKGSVCYESLVAGCKSSSYIKDLRNTPYWTSDPDLKRLELVVYIGCPVYLSGSIVGALAFYDKIKGDYTADQISFMAQLVDLIAFIEERRRVENDLNRNLQREKMLSEISTSAISDPDMDGLLAHCLEIIGLAMAADGVTILYHETDTQTFEKMAYWCGDDECETGTRQDFGDLLSMPIVRDVVEKGNPFQFGDMDTLSGHDAGKILKKHGVKTLLLIPLYYQQKLYGCCCLHRIKGALQWGEEDIAVIKAAMQILAQRLTRQSMAHRLDESEALVNQLFQLAPAAIYSIDLVNQRILTVNDYLVQASGYSREEFLSLNPVEFLTPRSVELYLDRIKDITAGKSVIENVEFEVVKKNGDVEWGRFHILHIYEGGRIVRANVVAILITEQKKAREALANYQKNLESMVTARTADLAKANQALRTEIEQRAQTAEKLQASSERLKEMNTAMRVLLDKRMEDHQHTEELVRINLKELIDPYLARLENSELRGSQKQLVELIRVNLDEVVASSMPELSSKYFIFSPNELQVVNLIRKGKTSKEMARLLNLSTRTVESYRDSIRKKLEIKNKKVNLRTYLVSI